MTRCQMHNVSKGRFERMQCVKCGAHNMVPVKHAAFTGCDVCGGTILVPVQEKAPRVNFSHGGRRPA